MRNIAKCNAQIHSQLNIPSSCEKLISNLIKTYFSTPYGKYTFAKVYMFCTLQRICNLVLHNPFLVWLHIYVRTMLHILNDVQLKSRLPKNVYTVGMHINMRGASLCNTDVLKCNGFKIFFEIPKSYTFLYFFLHMGCTCFFTLEFYTTYKCIQDAHICDY